MDNILADVIYKKKVLPMRHFAELTSNPSLFLNIQDPILKLFTYLSMVLILVEMLFYIVN